VSSGQAIVAEGRRLVEEAAARDLTMRLLGGAAIWLRATKPSRTRFGRDYPDLDLAAHRRQSRQLRDFLESERYEPERTFNATHGATRLYYHAPDRSYHLDVFLDTFAMSHELDLGSRLELETPTLPAAELLLTKLQVAEVNRKDLTDAFLLLLDHELGDEDGPARLNAARVAAVCAADWGLFTTFNENLGKLREQPQAAEIADKIGELERRLEEEPKTRTWKLRARIGRRVRWYEVPEEVTR
jgi:hypothetical protein